jgi:CheY-like chemotaxis protein
VVRASSPAKNLRTNTDRRCVQPFQEWIPDKFAPFSHNDFSLIRMIHLPATAQPLQSRNPYWTASLPSILAMEVRVHISLRSWRTDNVNRAQPASETNSAPLSIVNEADIKPGRGTILLVEDEAFVREITGEILEAAGYRVLKTRNAAEAIGAFRRYKAIVRLLLTDVVLPGRNGRELATALRKINPKLKTIFISGYPVVLMLATSLAISSSAWLCARNPVHAA